MDGQPPRTPLLLSVALHALVLTGLLVSPMFRPEPMLFESFEITMVSAPPAETPPVDAPASLPQEELVVEQPEPEPETPVEVETPLPEPEPDPEPEEEPEPPPPERTEPTREPPTETPPTPVSEPAEEETDEAGADVNVRLEGLRRDYPAYYNSIILEIRKCFRRPEAANARTVVYFVIGRDGTVSDARLVERSGNAAFDYAALGAIECAGNGRFGPLPDDLPYERLPIQFTFEPQRLGGNPVQPTASPHERNP